MRVSAARPSFVPSASSTGRLLDEIQAERDGGADGRRFTRDEAEVRRPTRREGAASR